MSATDDRPLTWFHETQDGLLTLTVGGTLTTASGQLLYDSALGILRNQGAMLIDVSAMVVTNKDAVAVFARLMAEALRWPDVLVVICARSVDVMQLFGADGVDPRLVFNDVAAGRSAASAKVMSVTEDLLPIAGAARSARNMTMDACLRWNEPGLVESAVVVASELVTNATVHARTMMSLEVRLRLSHLHIAVFDGSAAHAVARQPASARVGGHGLHLVEAFSAAWGSTSLPTGKVVWSALARPSV